MSLFPADEIRQSAQHAAILGKGEEANPYTDPIRHAAWIAFYEAYKKQEEEAQC